MTEQPKTIQLEPTWLGLLPVLLELAHNAVTDESRQTAREELRRMAKAADAYNALIKARQAETTEGQS
jgi:hypothetical protein